MLINKCGSPNGEIEIHCSKEELKEIMVSLGGSMGEYSSVELSEPIYNTIKKFFKHN